MKAPVTEALINSITNHIQADKNAIVEYVLNTPLAQQNDLAPILIQLKAQIDTLEAILDFKFFITTEDEVNNEV